MGPYAGNSLWERADSVLFGDVATPSDATALFPWQTTNSGMSSRFFNGASYDVGATTVRILGEQFADGGCQRSIDLRKHVELDDLTPADARQLAAVLLDAADEIDKLARLETQ